MKFLENKIEIKNIAITTNKFRKMQAKIFLKYRHNIYITLGKFLVVQKFAFSCSTRNVA